MKPDRLISFGCSLTYGHGLKDCVIIDNKITCPPSQFAWPKLVADQFNINCVNMSYPGSSNKKIWKAILDFDFQDNDIVFIHWSFPDRTTIFKKTETIDIGPWDSNYDYYQKIYDDNDALLNSKLLVDHANLFLKTKNVKVYNLIPDEDIKSILKLANHVNTHIPVYIKSLSENYPKALDNLHPGEECHKAVAEEIYKYLCSIVKIKKCFIKIYNHKLTFNNYKQFDTIIEKILLEEFGEEFLFEFDVWWRKCCVDFRVRNYSLEYESRDTNNKSSTTVWESVDNINSFADYFFKHDMFLKFKEALLKNEWFIEGPVIE